MITHEHRPLACAQWSFQFTGQLLVPTTGSWTFFLPGTTDDGTRVFIDGQPAVSCGWFVP